MFRLFLVAGYLGGFLVYSIPHIKRLEKREQTDPQGAAEESLGVIQSVLRRIFRQSGSTLTVIGAENIPDEPVLYVGEHRSYFDIVALYPLFPHFTAFVAKKEMEKWFTMADWMRLGKCLFLDRKDLKAGMKTILAGIDEVKEGISLFIFPEGTRNETADICDLMEFHEGSLRIASKSGCPVVPVAITGTRDIYENHWPFIRPAHVTVEFGEPFRIEDLPPEDRKKPGAYTRHRIIDMLKQEQVRRG